MVFLAPDPAQTLGPALAALTEGINHIINPDFQFQQAMQRALGANPQLAQNLADLETSNPGTLQKLGFGKDLTNTISAIKQSPASEVNNTSRPLVIEGIKSGIKGEIAKSTTAQNEAANSGTYFKSTATKAENEARASGPVADATIAKAKVTSMNDLDNLQAIPELKGLDMFGLAKQFLQGKADPNTMSKIYNNPAAVNGFAMALQSVNEEMNRAAQEIRDAKLKGNKTDDFYLQKAWQLYNETNVSSLDAWKQYVQDPSIVEPLKKLPPDQLTQEQKNLLAVDDAQHNLDRAQKVKQAQGLQNLVAIAQGRLQAAYKNGESEDSKSMRLSEVQSSLDELSKVTGVRYHVKIGRKPDVGSNDTGFFASFGNGNGLYYTDDQGNRIDPAKVFQTPPDARLMARASDFYSQYLGQKDPAIQKHSLDLLKTNHPDVYDVVQGLINKPKGK